MILSILAEFAIIIITVLKTLILSILFGVFNLVDMPETNIIGIGMGYLKNFFPDEALTPLISVLFVAFIIYLSLWAIKKVNDLPFIP